MNELTEFLTARGYVRIALTRSLIGHFHTTGTLNDRPVEILVDTGASCTVVSMAVAESLGLAAERLDEGAAGAGGTFEQFKIAGASLRLGEFEPRMAGPIGLDFEQINAPLRAQGSTEVDMILGTDVFDNHSAVIDYESLSLFLKTVVSN
jgi:clan AA aspartic protease (TIGR02281 family)